MTSVNQSQGPDIGGSRGGTCNSELKLGDTCDSCLRGIMMPPGGISFYSEEIAKYGNVRPSQGQYKIKCPRCGHWHTSIGLDLKTGFDLV